MVTLRRAEERHANSSMSGSPNVHWKSRTISHGSSRTWTEALAEVARGDVISREEHRARNTARLAALKE